MTPMPIRIPLGSIPGIATVVVCALAAEIARHPQVLKVLDDLR